MKKLNHMSISENLAYLQQLCNQKSSTTHISVASKLTELLSLCQSFSSIRPTRQRVILNTTEEILLLVGSIQSDPNFSRINTELQQYINGLLKINEKLSQNFIVLKQIKCPIKEQNVKDIIRDFRQIISNITPKLVACIQLEAIVSNDSNCGVVVANITQTAATEVSPPNQYLNAPINSPQFPGTSGVNSTLNNQVVASPEGKIPMPRKFPLFL